jgi:hypothetical protein
VIPSPKPETATPQSNRNKKTVGVEAAPAEVSKVEQAEPDTDEVEAAPKKRRRSQ